MRKIAYAALFICGAIAIQASADEAKAQGRAGSDHCYMNPYAYGCGTSRRYREGGRKNKAQQWHFREGGRKGDRLPQGRRCYFDRNGEYRCMSPRHQYYD